MTNSRNINFDDLKKAITPEITQRILAHFGLQSRFTTEEDGSLRGPCPFRCEKTTGRSFKITADGRAWFNHDRACQCLPINEETGQPIRGGNMLDFIRFKTGGTIREAGLLLDTLLKEPKTGEAKTKTTTQVATPTSSPTTAGQSEKRNPTFVERGLKSIDLDRHAEAIVSLGLEPETVTAFGAGVCSKGMMRGRLAFPLHNTGGELIAYTGFKLDKASDGPTWLLPKDFDPSLELIGFYAIPDRIDDISGIVITFDMLEAAYAAQTLGNHNAVVSILSETVSPEQERLLTALVKEQGYQGIFLIIRSRTTAISPEVVTQLILTLAHIAPTQCVVLT